MCPEIKVYDCGNKTNLLNDEPNTAAVGPVDITATIYLEPQTTCLVINAAVEAAVEERDWQRECKLLANFLRAAVTMTMNGGKPPVLCNEAGVFFTQTIFLMVYMQEIVLLPCLEV